MVRLEAQAKLITHAIKMAAFNAETSLARALNGSYARAGDEAYALIREALHASGDIIPGDSTLTIRLGPLIRSPPHPRPRRALRPAQHHRDLLPRHPARPALRSRHPTQALHKRSPMSGVLRPGSRPDRLRAAKHQGASSGCALMLCAWLKICLAPALL